MDEISTGQQITVQRELNFNVVIVKITKTLHKQTNGDINLTTKKETSSAEKNCLT
jgi:hypothetical protein